MTHDMPPTNRCSNEGCSRPVLQGEAFCETCVLEWTLFHRETRAACPVSGDRSDPRAGIRSAAGVDAVR